MAIDNAVKRKSISGIGIPCAAPGITSNVAKDSLWRRVAAWGYSFVSVLRIIKINNVDASLLIHN